MASFGRGVKILSRSVWPMNHENCATLVILGSTDILAEFSLALSDDRQPECNVRDNLKSMAMIAAALESCRSGQRISVQQMLSELL